MPTPATNTATTAPATMNLWRIDQPTSQRPPVVGRRVDRGVTAWNGLDVGQHLHAKVRREDDRDEPGGDQREAHDPEDVAGIFTGARSANPTGVKPMMVTSVPESIGAAVWLQA